MQGQQLREIVGENIRSYRTNAKLTQKDVASEVGITQAFLSEIEAGKASPSIDTLAAIAEALHTSPSFLLSLEGKFAMSPS